MSLDQQNQSIEKNPASERVHAATALSNSALSLMMETPSGNNGLNPRKFSQIPGERTQELSNSHTIQSDKTSNNRLNDDNLKVDKDLEHLIAIRGELEELLHPKVSAANNASRSLGHPNPSLSPDKSDTTKSPADDGGTISSKHEITDPGYAPPKGTDIDGPAPVTDPNYSGPQHLEFPRLPGFGTTPSAPLGKGKEL